MRKKKNLLPRLERVAHRLIEDPACFKGNWRDSFCSGEIRLELGCGKGQFITQLAQLNPDIFFIGIEKVPSVILSAVEKAELLQLENVRFIIGDAQCIRDFFADGEVGVIYLNFSDPWPSPKHWPRRLTHSSFLKSYGALLSDHGRLEMKTDNSPLFGFTCNELRNERWHMLEETTDLPESDENVQTEYETKFRNLGVPICRVIAVPHDC